MSVAPMKRTRHVASLEGDTSPKDVSPIGSPEPFKRFVQRLRNFDSAIELVHYFGESAKFALWCKPSLCEKRFVAFRAFAEDIPYEEPVRIFRLDDSIYIQLTNVSPIHQSISQYMNENPMWYGQGHGPFAGLRFALMTERAASAPRLSSRTDYSFSSRRRATYENPNVVGETQYGSHLRGEIGWHQRMKRFLENAAILAGIVVKIRHPWNFQDHDNNSIVLFYYERPHVVPPIPAPASGPDPVVPGGSNGARPSFGIILGRELTAVEITNLVATTGINPNFLYGHGRVQRPGGAPPGPDTVPAGRCWFDNAGDDDVYRFHIPARVLMQRANPHDDIIIGGVHVNINDLPDTANLTINCKHLMQYVADGVAAMPVPPGGNQIDLAPYGGPVNLDVALGPLGDAAVPLGQPIGGHNIGFLANAPGGTALAVSVAAIAAPEPDVAAAEALP